MRIQILRNYKSQSRELIVLTCNNKLKIRMINICVVGSQSETFKFIYVYVARYSKQTHNKFNTIKKLTY